MTEQEAKMMDAKLANLVADTAKLVAEGRALDAQTAKARVETILYPFAAGGAFVGAIIAGFAIFIRLTGA